MVTSRRCNVAITPNSCCPNCCAPPRDAGRCFDRHGLRWLRRASGPYESIRFFARAHGVDERCSCDELERAIAATRSRPGGDATDARCPGVADTIYRRYFLAGIAVVLSAGASWGAWLLWTIGLSGSFRAVSVHAVNAHGEAQIFGWVGLFIMGFAYQAFPGSGRQRWPRRAGGHRVRADDRWTGRPHGRDRGGRGLGPGRNRGPGRRAVAGRGGLPLRGSDTRHVLAEWSGSRPTSAS